MSLKIICHDDPPARIRLRKLQKLYFSPSSRPFFVVVFVPSFAFFNIKICYACTVQKNTLKVVVVWTNGKREGRDFTAASSLAIVLADCRWLANNHHHVTFYDWCKRAVCSRKIGVAKHPADGSTTTSGLFKGVLLDFFILFGRSLVVCIRHDSGDEKFVWINKFSSKLLPSDELIHISLHIAH